MFEDSGGAAIAVASDEAVDAERTVRGSAADGSLVEIVVYSAEPSGINASDLIALANDTSPVADDLTVHAIDVNSLEPQVVTATTPTTVSVAWKAPQGATEFELYLDSVLAAAGDFPNFSVTGLVPDQAYSLSLRSTHVAEQLEIVPPLPPTSQCPAQEVVHTTDLSTWDLTETRTAGHNELTVAGLRVYTEDASTQAKAAGYHPADVLLSDVIVAALNWSGTEAKPGLQLVVDFDGDGTEDGILVGEVVYGDDYWATNSSAQFVKDGAPLHTGGFGSADHGQLADWSTTFPSARVTRIGYSLGSGVNGDGIIESIVVGCASYTFALEPDPNTIDRDVSTSMELSVATRAESSSFARLGGPAVGRLGAPIDSTEFRYQTFIPYAVLADSPDLRDAPIETACIAGFQAAERLAGRAVFDDYPWELTFRGDDRPFTAPLPGEADNYRTSMLFRWSWDDNSFTRDNDTGITRIVRKDTNQVVASKTASEERMTFSDLRVSSNSVSVLFSHVANDPFCPSGADLADFGVDPGLGSITYQARVTMFRSGLVLVEGDRATMPAHEGWVRWNDQSKWSNAFGLTATRLACLVQAVVPILNYASGCSGVIKASVNRSTDKWIAASSNYEFGTLALTKSGRTYGWGGYDNGLLEPFAQGSCDVLEVVEVPVTETGETIRAYTVAAGAKGGTALTRDHQIATWGRDWRGSLGRAGNPHSAIPVSSIEFAAFDTAGPTTYAVSKSGNLYTWGPQLYDQQAWPAPNPDPHQTPHLAAVGYELIDVTVASGAVIALDQNGDLWGFGNNYYSGLLGENSDGWLPSLTRIPAGGTNFVRVAAVDSSAFALDSLGRAWTWGQTVVPTVSSPVSGDPGLALVDTNVKFDKLTKGNGIGLISSDGGAYVVDTYSSADTFEELRLPDPGQELVYVDGNLAIARSGEMLSLDGHFDPVTYEYVTTGWSNRGLPPVTTPKDPPRECYTVG
ncbi:MAG: hypothetical protein ACOH1M_01160 [Rhodoglobus sp.]